MSENICAKHCNEMEVNNGRRLGLDIILPLLHVIIEHKVEWALRATSTEISILWNLLPDLIDNEAWNSGKEHLALGAPGWLSQLSIEL